MLVLLVDSGQHRLLLLSQPHSRTASEKCSSLVEGGRCTNPCLPLARHCLSRIL